VGVAFTDTGLKAVWIQDQSIRNASFILFRVTGGWNLSATGLTDTNNCAHIHSQFRPNIPAVAQQKIVALNYRCSSSALKDTSVIIGFVLRHYVLIFCIFLNNLCSYFVLVNSAHTTRYMSLNGPRLQDSIAGLKNWDR